MNEHIFTPKESILSDQTIHFYADHLCAWLEAHSFDFEPGFIQMSTWLLEKCPAMQRMAAELADCLFENSDGTPHDFEQSLDLVIHACEQNDCFSFGSSVDWLQDLEPA